MIALLVLASIARCASAEFCPTNEDILTAVRVRDSDIAYALVTTNNPGEVVLIEPEPINGISDVVCGAEFPAQPPTIMCKFTVRYRSRNAYHVARLIRSVSGWRIDETLVVSRKRR